MYKFIAIIAAFAIVLPVSFGKISPSLQQQLKFKSNIDVFVSLKYSVQPLLKSARSKAYVTRDARLNEIVSDLKAFTKTSQASILDFLRNEAPTLSVEQFWITNKIFIRDVPANLIHKIARHPHVDEVHENAKVMIDSPTFEKNSIKNEDLTYGLKIIGVEEVWAQGFNGSGIRVGVIDTGVRHTHEALRTGYATEYGWYDPINRAEEPHDALGHGSHVAGTVAGTHNIGVAPGATHMHCAALSRKGLGDTRSVILCGQFMACPTLPDGSEPDCSKAPKIVNNSWGGPYFDFYEDIIDAWNALGTIIVFSIGNSGYNGCKSLLYPGGYNMDLISVGNTDETDSIYRGSSRGPSRFNKIKPEISAPGTDVISVGISSDTAYTTKTGTSMAAPHVAGAIALLLQANPNLIFNQIAQALYVSANTNVSAPTENCGGISESTIPNNSFGHGRLSISDALNYVKKYTM